MTAKKGKSLGVKALLSKAFGGKAAKPTPKPTPKHTAKAGAAKHSAKPAVNAKAKPKAAPAKATAPKMAAAKVVKGATKAHSKTHEKTASKVVAKTASTAVSKPTQKKAAEKSAPVGKKNQSGASVVNSQQRVLTTGRVGRAARANSPAVCREAACELLATTANYCRMHYIKNWKKIKRKEMILKERKLNHYIEELVSKYPDKYIEAIRQDLENEKDFAKVIADLEIDESLDDFDSVETESAEGIIDNIKRDFDDSDDVF